MNKSKVVDDGFFQLENLLVNFRGSRLSWFAPVIPPFIPVDSYSKMENRNYHYLTVNR
jgi:hypothetical protein